MLEITKQITDFLSTQEWTTDPDMIEVTINESFLDFAERAVEFMSAHDEHWPSVSARGPQWKLFEINDDKSEHKDGSASYREMEPEYRLYYSTAVVNRDGHIEAEIYFKHSNDKFILDIGRLDSLREEMNSKKPMA
jgi:hypothetical protein